MPQPPASRSEQVQILTAHKGWIMPAYLLKLSPRSSRRSPNLESNELQAIPSSPSKLRVPASPQPPAAPLAAHAQ
ncbi:hypothetical protein Q8F55_003667 [Vanrija albida]|uniref:Uncharacterized protein n=1 Tax=Vanrija albida TaxID=181172 RepID=A0ABR3Q4T8_9TREE